MTDNIIIYYYDIFIMLPTASKGEGKLYALRKTYK